MEQIDPSQVHLWLAFPDEISDPRLLAEYRQLLSEDELQQQRRFYFERDRHRYLVTRAMVRAVLSRYADVEPHRWRFALNEFGKPSIAAEHASAGGIEFNVSHTDGLVAMAVARGRAVGVDVENVSAQRAPLEIADRFFAPEEVKALRALPVEQQPGKFFEYWTLKEAYIKARGTGLSVPLDRFAIQFAGPDGIRLTCDPALHDFPRRWMFWQRPAGPAGVLAVCAERFEPLTARLCATRSWP